MLLRFVVLLCLSGCGRIEKSEAPKAPEDAKKSNFGSLLGNYRMVWQRKGVQQRSSSRENFGINKFLWEAAVRTVDYMKILEADPESGHIITDWYIPLGAPDTRIKLDISILGPELRADAVKVAVERQTRTNKTWRDCEVPGKRSTQLEILIVANARKIKNSLPIANHK